MSTSTTESPATDRAADTRDRLLRAGLTLFSQLGLEGVRTRQLAQAAGVNQSAIPYHFGGKEGVYAAVLEQTAQAIAERLDWPDAAPRAAAEAALQLEAIMRGFAAALLDSEASAARSLLLAREQLQPTPKFEAIHAVLFMPLHEAVTRRVAVIRGEAPDSRACILRAHAILGQAIVFAVAREALLRRLGTGRLTRAMVAEIAAMVGATAVAAARD
ncbi:CerR family C-terminal domain-containing protein [Achromobacter xylosoxidans]|uniref:Transcriptional regulator n=1 Tax=Alcaligenes xylosoxydans xylosoxydans TaxID=85698 RepID=A0A1R1JUU0_ALCXX|nr:CerR family C-terminal domain-containing protein [Achromobacter xylosoxidans]OMG89045.1 transcriptional regulator [Achromobacter xylosoxidans]BEG73890.1 HTH-type transcriptional dual regulator CecR [Achromobacter xylosoxidans]